MPPPYFFLKVVHKKGGLFLGACGKYNCYKVKIAAHIQFIITQMGSDTTLFVWH